MKLPSLNFLISAASGALVRFPFTLFSAVTGVICLMLILEDKAHDSSLFPKIWMMAQIGLPLFTGLVALAESQGWSQARKWAALVIGLGVLTAYYFLMPDVEAPDFEAVHMVRYVMLLLVAHLFVAVSPFMNKRPVQAFWEYNKQLFAAFIVGAAYTIIIWGGLSFAVLAVNELFHVEMNSRVYAHLFILLAGIFNTLFFLNHFPRSFDPDDAEPEYNIVFKTLCKYILIPIVGLYFLILYAYSAKILLTWQLPIGWVSSLVIGFSVAGIFTYLLNYRLPQFDKSLLPGLFHRWFWWIMLPMTLMLFVAIGRRISDYGVTEQRFMVAHIGLWLLLCGLYFVFSKTDNIKFIPASLALFGLTAVLGPLSAFEISYRSQRGEIRRILEQNDRFADGKIKKSGKPMLEAEANQVVSALDFLERRGRLNELQEWFPMPLDSFPAVEGTYGKAALVGDWLALNSGAKTPAVKYIHVEADGNQLRGPVQPFTQYYFINASSEIKPVKNGRWLEYNDQKDGLKLWELKNGTRILVDEYILAPWLKEWAASDEYGNYHLPAGKENIELKGKKTTANLVIHRLDYKVESEKCEISDLTALILMR